MRECLPGKEQRLVRAPSFIALGVQADSVFHVGTSAGDLRQCVLNAQATELGDWAAMLTGASLFSMKDPTAALASVCRFPKFTGATVAPHADKHGVTGGGFGADSKHAKPDSVRWRDPTAMAAAFSMRSSNDPAKQPHIGPVSAIQRCPAAPAVLLSCGADGRLKLWRADSGSEGMLLEPFDVGCSAASWCPQRPTVLAVRSLLCFCFCRYVNALHNAPLLTHAASTTS